MKTLVQLIAGLLATSLVAGMTLATALSLQDTKNAEPGVAAVEASAPTGAPDEAQESVEGAVQQSAQDEKSERRKSLIDDAVEALDETQVALDALDAGDTEKALESLAIAVGKLDLVVARNPRLALAPVDVRLVTHDLYATVDAVQDARRAALEHLEEGRLQDARALIEGLRSDVVVEVVNMPLATYPAAIAAITPLIDEGEIEAAKTGLQQALNTVVVQRHIHPLPVLRAEHMLARAEGLATKEAREDAENEELTRLLDGARAQLEFAQALGYGYGPDFNSYYEQLDQIAAKTGNGKSGEGFFDKIRNALSSFGSKPSAN